MTKEIAKLPTYDELVNMEIINSKENDFQVLLNQNPPEKFIKEFNKSRYLPIDKVEYLLTALFVRWRVEVINYSLIANSVAVQVRVFYVSPVTGIESHHDGLGAWPIQTKSGCSPVDFNSITHAAIQMALPSAKSLAIRDATDHIGRIFGKDLNRKELVNYENSNGRFDKPIKEDKESKRLENLIVEADK